MAESTDERAIIFDTTLLTDEWRQHVAQREAVWVIGRKVCEALGLNTENLRSLVIRLEAGQLPKVEATYFAHESVNALANIFQQYELVPKG